MPYVPHTDKDTKQMLEAIGVEKIEDLFEAVPEEILQREEFNLPEGLSEPETRHRVEGILKKNKNPEVTFMGGGFYNHFIPAHVWNVSTRSEFVTSYTPYQPEMSQGILQSIFEYQTMITRLTGMYATNASMYDGSSATGEVCLMAGAITRKQKILVGRNVNPQYREVMQTYCDGKDLEFTEVPFDMESGKIDMAKLGEMLSEDIAGVFVQSPNFFGVIEDMEKIVEMAHEKGALAIQVITEAMSMGILKTPGEMGVDIVVGEGQSFGIPLSGGGPSFGFLATTEKHMRKLPGRIAGESEDTDGNKAYVLTLQAREQHIRREKASSNICTNQTLFAIRGLMYLVTLGKNLRGMAALNHKNALHFQNQLSEKGWGRTFKAPFFNEFVVDADVATLKKLREMGIAGGIDLGKLYPELEGKLLVCVTEMITAKDMENYLQAV